MAIPVIETSKYMKGGKVLVDGNEWTVKLPGAGTTLRLNQAERRIKLLDRKVNDGTATEEDFNLYDKLENETLEVFKRLFSDGTEENTTVSKWVDETPLPIIYKVFEDLKNQTDDKVVDGQPEPTA